MIKKINSEYKVNDNNSFVVTMGTSNKKNPEVIYSIISTYVTPNTEDIDNSVFTDISKNIKKKLRTSINNFGLCENDVIVVSDVATNRMLYGKPSYFDIEIYFKPQKSELKNNKFKNISQNIYNTYVKGIISNVEKTLLDNDFVISKNKTKVKIEI